MNKENTRTHKHTMGYYSSIIKEELNLLHVCDKNGWTLNLLCMSKPSREKQKLHNLTYIENLKKKKTNSKFIDTKENRGVVARSMGWGKNDLGERDQKYKLPVIN